MLSAHEPSQECTGIERIIYLVPSASLSCIWSHSHFSFINSYLFFNNFTYTCIECILIRFTPSSKHPQAFLSHTPLLVSCLQRAQPFADQTDWEPDAESARKHTDFFLRDKGSFSLLFFLLLVLPVLYLLCSTLKLPFFFLVSSF